MSTEDIAQNSTIPEFGMSVRDHFLAITKAGLELVPLGGALASLISDYVPTSTEESVKKAWHFLNQRLLVLEGRTDLSSVNRDEFADLYKKCLWVVTNTSRTEKLAGVAAVLSNGILREEDSEKLAFSELDYFVRCLDGLSISAIQVLCRAQEFVKRPHANKDRIDFDWLAQVVGDDDFAMGLLMELNGFNLLAVGPIPTTTYASKPYSNYPIRLTNLGQKFVNRVLLNPDSFTAT